MNLLKLKLELGAGRRAYALAHAFELLMGILALSASLSFWLYPENLARSSIGQALHPWDYAWNAGYGLAGLLIVLGILAPRPRFEAAGVCLFAGAVTINGIAVLYFPGPGSWISMATYIAVVLACFARLTVLYQRTSR